MNMKERGQSLVETAIIMPVLLIMLLGVFEVGYALRNYIIVANANREAARFLSRGLYEDQDGVRQFLNSVSNQIDIDLADNTTIIIHRADADVRNPYDETDDEYSVSFEVYGVPRSPRIDQGMLEADVIRGNREVHYNTYEREKTIARSQCDLGKADFCVRLNHLEHYRFDQIHVDWPEGERFVYVETFYDHNQLMHLFGNRRIGMYTHTMMRINSSRGL